MKILATYNIKGGVGKTATAINLGFAAANTGLRVLIWDLDPQAAATYYFRIRPKLRGGNRELLSKKRDLRDFVKATNYKNLDLIPAAFTNRYMDKILDDKKQPLHRLARVTRVLRNDYDLLLFDCAPSLSTVAENVFIASDALLVPLIPTPLSIRAYLQLKRYVKKKPEFKIRLIPFFSMVDRRKKLHREVVLDFHKDNSEIMRTFIGYHSEVERMGSYRAPVQVFAKGSGASRGFNLLWDEISGKLLS